MNELLAYCEKQEEQLSEIIKAAEYTLEQAPIGSLNISYSNQVVQYYWKRDKGRGEYIRAAQISLARALAQKDYAKKVLKLAQKNKQQIEKFKERYQMGSIEELYRTISIQRQALITPYVLSQQEYAKKWEEVQYIQKNQHSKRTYPLDENTGIMTDKGEWVRSKSEKILADKLYKMNIPYVYEKPLYLKGYGWVTPDFVVLNCRTRQEFFWEHMGMMGELDYVEKSLKKIELYTKNHIHVGKNLLLTYESTNVKLNMQNLDEIIKVYLM